MPELMHPDYAKEQARLDQTQDVIAIETVRSQDDLANANLELLNARKFDPDSVPLREMLVSSATQQLRNLQLAAMKPYFTRVDFIENGGHPEVYYIGKYGVTKMPSFETVVVDWRSPIANLYYSGQVGPMHYVAPDGEISGELKLKRQFGITRRSLETMFDADVVSQDAYLQSVLGAMSGDRLKEIVTTIQAEQNFVIRHAPNKPLIVQGVAGSGKTTIALHRIAYLLYAYQDSMRPEQMLILAPNPLFLNYISSVLPDLGVDKVRQTTFHLFVSELLGKALPKTHSHDRLGEMLSLDDKERDKLAAILRFKGSLKYGKYIDEYLSKFEHSMIPKMSVKFGPVSIMTKEQLIQFLLVDNAPFSLQQRLDELKKRIRKLTKDSCRKVEEWLNDECDKRVTQIKRLMRDGEERRARLIKLYSSRDERIKQAQKEVLPFVEKVMKQFPSIAPLDIYKQFLLCAHSDPMMQAASEYTLSRLESGKVDAEDIAPLCILAMRAMNLTRQDIRHIVIDEAQDFSPLEFMLLGRISRNNSISIVGDLMQGIHGYRGLYSWNEILDGVYGGNATVHHLVTSYRNTVEIMNFALRVARNRPVPGQMEAKPVLRHGEEPKIFTVPNAKQQLEKIIELLYAWKAQGLNSIAIIDRSEAKLAAIVKKLPADLNVVLMDTEKQEYHAGIMAAPASSIKGLEFDGVIIANTNSECFPERDLDARLLYVCLTRPLHMLACVSIGEVTGLLQ